MGYYLKSPEGDYYYGPKDNSGGYACWARWGERLFTVFNTVNEVVALVASRGWYFNSYAFPRVYKVVPVEEFVEFYISVGDGKITVERQENKNV